MCYDACKFSCNIFSFLIFRFLLFGGNISFDTDRWSFSKVFLFLCTYHTFEVVERWWERYIRCTIGNVYLSIEIPLDVSLSFLSMSSSLMRSFEMR